MSYESVFAFCTLCMSSVLQLASDIDGNSTKFKNLNLFLRKCELVYHFITGSLQPIHGSSGKASWITSFNNFRIPVSSAIT